MLYTMLYSTLPCYIAQGGASSIRRQKIQASSIRRQKFRLELSSQFFPNFVKLIFFDFNVWQESVLITKVPKSLEHPLT